MALSEEERRVLDEMERQLRASSNDVVTVPESRRVNATAAVIGVVVIIGGIGILLAGIVSGLTPLGVAGFGDMGAIRVSSQLDPDVAQLVMPYKRMRNFA
jgi:hypothetical protein